jgi:hypothetical protein
MGFNKRFFSMGMLLGFYTSNRENGIEEAIGKTEGFIFEMDGSMEVVNHWLDGEKDEARKMMDDYVLRISTEVSSDN